MGTRSIEEKRMGEPQVVSSVCLASKLLLKEMLERAAAANYEGIMITVDTAVLGRRERDGGGRSASLDSELLSTVPYTLDGLGTSFDPSQFSSRMLREVLLLATALRW